MPRRRLVGRGLHEDIFAIQNQPFQLLFLNCLYVYKAKFCHPEMGFRDF